MNQGEQVGKRNVNAEWAALKETADIGSMSAWEIEYKRSEEEREKCRRRGALLLRVVRDFPERPSEEEKVATLARVHRVAEKVRIGQDLESTLQYRMKQDDYQKIGKLTFPDEESAALTSEEEASVEALRAKVYDLTEMEPGALADKFPSGTFLYHGSKIEKVEKTLRSGGLKNGVALVEDDPEVSAFELNSGYEGISWSLNQIDALPGTRGHIAGFVAAPEDILLEQERLVVPSRPAPYEVLQLSGEMDAEEMYRLKTQYETWGDGGASLGEKNDVFSNLMRMLGYDPDNMFMNTSRVYDYAGDTSAEEMREYFAVDDDGAVTWDADIQQKFEVPPALPWFQSLIDRGMLERGGYEELQTVDDVVQRARNDKEFLRRLIATVQAERKSVEEAYDALCGQAAAIRKRPEDMYFVTSHRDLEDWLKVMARNGVEPKGILLYDDEQVVMENFANKYEGNHRELGAEIGRAIGVNRDFWRDEMGMEPDELPRSGSAGQVILESAVKRDREIRVKDGSLVVESTR